MCELNQEYWKLIVSVLGGEATWEEEKLLEAWMAESESHRQLFEQVARTWKGIKPGNRQAEFDTERGWERFMANIYSGKHRWRLRNWCWGVAVCAASIAAFFFVLFPRETVETQIPGEIRPGCAKAILVVDNQTPIHIGSGTLQLSSGGSHIANDSLEGLSFRCSEEESVKVTYNQVIIPVGGEYKLTLSDGTEVWLNSETEIRFPSIFKGGKREVEFTGEAYFKVAPDIERPFYVKTEDVTVKVYGTEFNVRAYHDDACVSTTLVEGKVSVSLDGEEAHEMKMDPSQQLTYSKEAHKMEVKEVDVNLYTSWKDGCYSFDDTSLKEIFGYLRRWYVFSVDYEAEGLEELTFTGEFQKDRPIEYGLELIRMTCEVDFRIEGNRIIVLKLR